MGKHKVTSKFISFNITRSLWYKLTQQANALGISRTTLLVSILETEMKAKKVELTPDNQAKVVKETAEEAASRRNFRMR